MNIHEYQAKELLKKYGAPVSNGVAIFRLEDISNKINQLNTKQFVLKAQIHAGGRGKAGGIKLVKNLDELRKEAQEMFGKVLITHQTGSEGKKVKTLYIEEASEILKEFYLSCLVDRESSKIAFISSTEGGMDIEKVAKDAPEKIITTKVELNGEINDENILKIIKPFSLNNDQIQEAKKLIKALYKILTEKDASLIEINPLIITKDEKIIMKVHDNFVLSIFFIKTKYNVNNKIQWPATAACQFSLKIKIGAIKKKRDPIRECGTEFVNFFSILNEKNNCK